MDVLVNLYNLPQNNDTLAALSGENITIRRALHHEKTKVLDWIADQFSSAWSDECAVAFRNQPVSCYVALQNNKLLGFAAFECTQKNYFGPLGVVKTARKKGIGSNLLIHCLTAMQYMGYAYAVIGGVNKETLAYYQKFLYVQEIENSTPGIYRDPIS